MRLESDRPLRVGLNLLFMQAAAGGAGRYGRELPGALLAVEPATEIHVFVSRDVPRDLRREPWADSVRWVRCPVGMRGLRALRAFEFAALPLLASARRLDVLHSLANVGPAIVPAAASVVSLLDVIWMRPPEDWGGSLSVQRSLRRIVEHDMRHADRVFAISHAGAQEISRTLSVSPERIHVTPLGVRAPTAAPASEDVVRAELELGEARVVLSVAQKHPYKNLHRLVRALPELDDDVVLVAARVPHAARARAAGAGAGAGGRGARAAAAMAVGGLACGPVCDEQRVRAALARGGLRAAGAGGDAARGAGRLLEHPLAERGSRGRCAAVRSRAPGGGGRRDPAAAGGSRSGRASGRARPRASRELHMGSHGGCEPRRLPPSDRRSLGSAAARLVGCFFPLACPVVPRVLIVRGHQATPWELAPWRELPERFEVAFLLTRSNRFATPEGLAQVRVRALRDLLPSGVAGDAGAAMLGDRYLGATDSFASTDVVHAEELSYWFAAEAARRKRRHGFRLVQTVWETLPLMAAYRNRHARAYRELVLAETDLFLPATERAAQALRLEGVEESRIHVCPPGVDVDRFAVAPPAPPPTQHTIVSPGRLVWEKGHQDVLRALAALHRGIVTLPDGAIAEPRLLIVGSGPEEDRLRAHAAELGLAGSVEIGGAPYERMPSVFAGASAMVLASQASASAAYHPFDVPHAFWEEQFGMVLAEAMAAGLSIVTTTSGAIPEVVTGAPVDLVAGGDWIAIARALAAGPLSRPPGARVSYPAEIVRRYSTAAAAERLAVAYDRVLAA